MFLPGSYNPSMWVLDVLGGLVGLGLVWSVLGGVRIINQVERGVVFTGAPHMIHRHANGMEEWMAFFQDPDGKLLALMSQVDHG